MFRAYGLCALLFIVCHAFWGQQPPADPLGENLFPPELVIQHQQAIGLNDEQRNSIKAEIQKAQVRFMDLQWQLQTEMETMVSIVKEPRVDEQQGLAQLDKILGLEREVKRTQITLVVRIKNALSAEQQARLREIKNKLR